MEKTKWLLSIICGAISAFTKQYSTIIMFVVAAVALDWITGVIGEKAVGHPITSKKGTIGFWKKMALFAGLFLGFYLDYFIPYALDKINIELPVKGAIFGMVIGCYIVINECISICENIYKANQGILPKWIITTLQLAKTQIDKEGD
jgi:phage-related holin